MDCTGPLEDVMCDAMVKLQRNLDILFSWINKYIYLINASLESLLLMVLDTAIHLKVRSVVFGQGQILLYLLIFKQLIYKLNSVYKSHRRDYV